MNGFIGESDVRRVSVGVGIDGHRLNAHCAACPHHAERDLAAIGDQNFAKGFFTHWSVV
ncbi:MAG: hypothetical protein JMDDDDMK_04671 [Acidobacteria bacterium]|nr:hypothetical protein [Acidobacteriota bacterium]